MSRGGPEGPAARWGKGARLQTGRAWVGLNCKGARTARAPFAAWQGLLALGPLSPNP